MIDIRENPLSKTPNYKEKLIDNLPELIKLNREEIERDDDDDDEGEEEEEEEEEDVNVSIDKINKKFRNIENADITRIDPEVLINTAFDDVYIYTI